MTSWERFISVVEVFIAERGRQPESSVLWSIQDEIGPC